jgi:hypothetical protein
MKKTLTYTSIIVATLLIGFIIGFLVSGRLAKQRIHRMRAGFTEQGFNRNVVRALDPTPEQMEELRPIVQKHARAQRKMMNSVRDSQDSLFNQFRADILPYLTDEQMKKLDRMHKNFKRKMDHKGSRDRRQPEGRRVKKKEKKD